MAHSLSNGPGLVHTRIAGSAGVSPTPVDSTPVIQLNVLSTVEGMITSISRSNFLVTDTDHSDDDLVYTVNSVMAGQFETTAAPGTAIFTFSQSDVNNGLIVFVHDGSENAPSFSLMVTDGVNTVGPSLPSLSHAPVNSAPTLTTNALIIKQGQTVVLGPGNFAVATDPDDVDTSLTFTLSNVTGGSFVSAGTSNPVTSFNQQQLIDGGIEFADDGDQVAPSFQLEVSDGVTTSPSATGIVNFDATPMLFVIETTSPDETFTLPLVSGGSYNFIADWGDDSAEDTITSFAQAEVTHTFATPGQYTVRLCGRLTAWSFNNTGDKDKLLSVINLGDTGWTDLSGAFYGCLNLTNFEGGVTTNVTTMLSMFRGATQVTPNTSKWDVSNVAVMSSMFQDTINANPDVSQWDTSNVLRFSSMFRDATVAGLDVSNWDTSRATRTDFMFRGYAGPEIDVENWSTDNVTSMAAMFSFTGLNPDVSNWATGNVSNFAQMFFNNPTAQPDTSTWDTSSALTMRTMFSGATTANPNVSNWDTSSTTDMVGVFRNARAATPDVTRWDTSSALTMGNMFENAVSANPDVGSWVTSAVVSMNFMFAGASNASPDTTNWDVSNVTTMEAMFSRTSVANPNTDLWDLNHEVNLQQLFDGALGLTRNVLAAQYWDNLNITRFGLCFRDASNVANFADIPNDWK